MNKSDPFYQDEFPAVDYATWRPRVEQELGGAGFEKTLCHRLADGFEIQPLYCEETAPTGHDPARFPCVFPFTRGASLPRCGAGWWIGSEIADPDPAAARQALAGDLALGAELLWLRFGEPGGLAWSGPEAAAALLEEVEPRYLQIVLDAGAAAVPVATQFLAWAGRAGLPSATLRGCLGGDPLGALAATGRLPSSLEEAWRELAELAAFCAADAPELRAALVSTAIWHRAGATPAWEVGLGLAGGLETLRAFERHGLEPEKAAHQVLFAHELSSEICLEIAKLRAMRLVWSKVLAASGAGEVAAADQRHVALSSSVAATRVDPWVNLLRSTAQIFAAAVGGADGLVIRPWDAPLGRPEASARRFALTSQYVLAQESHLRAVADPAGGSWAFEALTDALAREAWKVAQDIEKRGGLAAAITSGYVREKLAALAASRRRDVARRKTRIVGVSVFPLLGEDRPTRAQATASAGIEPPAGTVAPPLETFRPAEDFEELRLFSDAAAQRPRIFLAQLGDGEGSRARAEFCAGLFPAGGVAVVQRGAAADPASLAAAFTASGCRSAVLAAGDEIYAAQGQDAARALKEAGCDWLLLAGRPGDDEAALRRAGVDGFVFPGADVVAVLAELLRREEPR